MLRNLDLFLIAGRCLLDKTLVLVVMTVNAQQFPVAAVSRVIVVVVVAVVNGEFLDIGAGEFPRASTTNPRVEF